MSNEAIEEEPREELDLSCFSGNLRRDDHENARDCWRIANGNNFRVRGKRFCYDKSKVLTLHLSPCYMCLNNILASSNIIIVIFLKISAGKHLMDLVAVDWLKDTKRMDHVVRRQGCAAQASCLGITFPLLIVIILIRVLMSYVLSCFLLDLSMNTDCLFVFSINQFKI